MTDDWQFECENASWTKSWHSSSGLCLKLHVIGGADHLKTTRVQDQLRNVTEALDETIGRASTFAWNSEYRDDISLAGGIDASDVVVKQFDDLAVWFNLRNSNRMVGVMMRNNELVDIYCDTP